MSRLLASLSRVVAVLAVVPAIMVVAGSIGSRHWLCDLCADAVAQCLWCLLLATAVLAAARHWRLLLASLPFTVAASLRVLPMFVGSAPAAAALAPPLRLCSVNVLCDNDDHDSLIAALRRSPVDVLVVLELTESWRRALDTLRAELPHYAGRTDPIFGVGIWSRYPLAASAVIPLGFPWAPALTAVVATPHGDVSILALHPPRPGYWPDSAAAMTQERDTALAAVPAVLAALPRPHILAGDCNATPWSASFSAMVAACKLHDTAAGQGWQPTWPTWLPSLLRIPIDQVWVGDGIAVRSRRVGPHIGSDHLPVFVDLQLAVAPH
jgi:endonuclease/exonuclease/phosphatase (EEP) superfamily protein YafD